jgi:NAD(P)-dependent dehydrogenase (short-subunit alcohol dehydrogenase family)
VTGHPGDGRIARYWAIAREVGIAGAKIVVTSNQACAETLANLSAHVIECTATTGDIGVDTDLDRLVAGAFQAFGQIDILVRNAGTLISY